MLTNYTERKNEVIAEYNRFDETVQEFIQIVTKAGLPNPMTQFKTSIDDAARKYESIRADRFRLMIAGESKSGKSTFINAYLGVELLPMDVKQCTSSIVEIKYGEKFKLVATYADSKKRVFDSEDAIRNFLKSNAALSDDYRDIPVPTINHDILVRYGKKSKDDMVNIPASDIRNFIAAPEIQAANIHRIEDYDTKIRNYIEQNKASWKNIVVNIEILFPFKDEALRGIEIIDSPGVCARGGVAEITQDYIENADAFIFLKPIVGQSLEATQFNDFMKNASVERNKNALFLVLTRATNETPANLKRLEEEVYKQFKQLNKKNIIIVDSKAELYANMFSTASDIQPLLLEMNKSGVLDDFVGNIWGMSFGDKNTFINGLMEKANFKRIDEALSVFGRKAHYLALLALLDTMSRVYTRIIGDLEGHVSRFQEKADDPTELAKKIGEIKQELEVINNKMYRGVDEIVSRYNGDESDIKKNADNAVIDFKRKVEKIDPNDNDAFRELEGQAMQKIDVFKNLQKDIQKAVVSECNKALVAISNDSEIPYTSLEPDFSEDTFKKIKDSTESKAQETHSYETGVTFTKTHSYSEYSRNKHFKIVRDSIYSRLDTIKNDLIKNLISFVGQISKQYMTKLQANASAKKSELDAIYEAKLNAEQIRTLIDDISRFNARCTDAKRESDKLKGGIDKYVQQNA